MSSPTESQKLPKWLGVVIVLAIVAFGDWVQRRGEYLDEIVRQQAITKSDVSAENPASPSVASSDPSVPEDSPKTDKTDPSDATDTASKSIKTPAAKSSPPREGSTAAATPDRNVTPSRGPPSSATKLGVLKDIGNRVLVSTAGLRYTPGSAEGHRLDHVRRHDNDQPARTGKHGVFDGDEQQMLATIDEGWLLVLKKDRRVQTSIDANRAAHDIDFSRRIGFIGGKEGKRLGNPPARRLKLVVEGSNVVTAYPY